MPTFFPIIFVHGWGGPQDLVRDFGAADERDPYAGWNTGHRYNDPDGWIKFRNTELNFEGFVLRLVKDFNYYDASNDEALTDRTNFLKKQPSTSSTRLNDQTLAKSLWVFRYYEYNAEYLQLSDKTKDALKKELVRCGYLGPLAGIPYYAALLAIKIQQVAAAESNRVSNWDKMPGLGLGKIALVGHSMGGLISRFAIQYNLFGAGKNVARLMTLATPHDGARWATGASLLRLFPSTRNDDIQYFMPDWVRAYLGGKDPNGVVADENKQTHRFKLPLDTHLNHTDVFCLVGTRHADYTPLPRTDGIVDQREAYLEGYPYAFTYNTHDGEHGIRQNHDGYQGLRRFLFGNLYVRLHIKEIVKKPKNQKDATDKEFQADAKFFFHYFIKPRGVNTHLNELSERAENQPLPRTLDELRSYLKKNPYVLYDGFADSQALAQPEARAAPGIKEQMQDLPHLQLDHSSFVFDPWVGARSVGGGYDMISLDPGTRQIIIEDQTFKTTLEVVVTKRN